MRAIEALLAALLFLPAPALADDGGGGGDWTVKDDLQSRVQAFTDESDLLADPKLNNRRETMVFGGEGFSLPLLPLDDLVACFHLTNPDSVLKVETRDGGGLDITVPDVQFAKGKWTAELRTDQKQKIDMLDSSWVHVVKRLKIHTLVLDDPQERARAIRLMAAACLEK